MPLTPEDTYYGLLREPGYDPDKEDIIALATDITGRLDALENSSEIRSVADVAALLANDTFVYSGDGIVVAPGDIIEARKEGVRYLVAASAEATPHVTTAGGVKLFVLPTMGRYDAAAWGPLTATNMEKAFQDVLRAVKPTVTNFQESPSATFVAAGLMITAEPIVLEDAAALDGLADAMGVNVDMSALRIVAASGGSLAPTTPILTMRVRNSASIHSPGIDCANICSGIYWDRCIQNVVYAGQIVERQANGGYAHWMEESDNTTFNSIQLYEQTRADALPLRQAAGVHINAYDVTINSIKGGWCQKVITLGTKAAEVSLHDIHPFNGTGLGTLGQTAVTSGRAYHIETVAASDWSSVGGGNPAAPGTTFIATGTSANISALGTVREVPINPIIIESFASGDVYVFDSYLDNGKILCKGEGDVHILGGHALELTGSVYLTGPMFEKWCTAARNGGKPGNRILGCEGLSYGLYNNSGVLSPAGSGADWGGDPTALNTFWDEGRIPEAVMRVMRRGITVYHGTDDTPTEQFVKQGGRHGWAWYSSAGGVTSAIFNWIDPNNGEQRFEAPRTVVDGILGHGAKQEVTISGGIVSLAGANSHSNVVLVSETGTSDTVTNITGGFDGARILLRPRSGHTITLAHDDSSALSTGKMYLRRGGANRVLALTTDVIELHHDGFNWISTDNINDGITATSFASRPALAAVWTDGAHPAGTLISDSVVTYVSRPGSTVISDLPGLEPYGEATADHYAQNTTPGTTDMASAINTCLTNHGRCTLLSGDYAVGTTIAHDNVTLIGQGAEGDGKTRLIGLSASLAVGDAVVRLGRTSRIKALRIEYDSLTGSEAQDERIGLDVSGETFPLQRGSEIDLLGFDRCGTAIGDRGAGMFSVTVGTIEIDGHSYAGVDVRGPGGTGNRWGNVYINGADAYSPAYGFNLEQNSPGSLGQINVEHQLYSAAPFRVKNASGGFAAVVHIEGVDLATGAPFVQCDRATFDIALLSVIHTRATNNSTALIELVEAEDPTVSTYENDQCRIKVSTLRVKGIARPSTSLYPSYPTGRTGLHNVSGWEWLRRAPAYDDRDYLVEIEHFDYAGYSAGATEAMIYQRPLHYSDTDRMDVARFGRRGTLVPPGKNWLLNPAFATWANTSVTGVTTATEVADDWFVSAGTVGIDASRQDEEYGRDNRYTLRVDVPTAGTFQQLYQDITNVHELLGSEVVLSFDMKADVAGQVFHQIYCNLNTGSGGSPASVFKQVIAGSSAFLNASTNWQRYELPFTMVAASAVTTMGTSPYFRLSFQVNEAAALRAPTIDLRNIKLERGMTATDFSGA